MSSKIEAFFFYMSERECHFFFLPNFIRFIILDGWPHTQIHTYQKVTHCQKTVSDETALSKMSVRCWQFGEHLLLVFKLRQKKKSALDLWHSKEAEDFM